MRRRTLATVGLAAAIATCALVFVAGLAGQLTVVARATRWS